MRKSLDKGTPDARHALAAAYFNYAAFKEDKLLFIKAREIWEKLSEKYPGYKRYVKKADKIINNL